MVRKVVIPATNSVLTVVVFGSKPNNAFNLFISYITIDFSLFFSIFSSPFPQPNPIVFSGRTKIRKNNEECLILHIFNYTERLILQVSGYSNKLSRVTDALNISEYSLLTSSAISFFLPIISHIIIPNWFAANIRLISEIAKENSVYFATKPFFYRS